MKIKVLEIVKGLGVVEKENSDIIDLKSFYEGPSKGLCKIEHDFCNVLNSWCISYFCFYKPDVLKFMTKSMVWQRKLVETMLYNSNTLLQVWKTWKINKS